MFGELCSWCLPVLLNGKQPNTCQRFAGVLPQNKIPKMVSIPLASLQIQTRIGVQSAKLSCGLLLSSESFKLVGVPLLSNLILKKQHKTNCSLPLAHSSKPLDVTKSQTNVKKSGEGPGFLSGDTGFPQVKSSIMISSEFHHPPPLPTLQMLYGAWLACDMLKFSGSSPTITAKPAVERQVALAQELAACWWPTRPSVQGEYKFLGAAPCPLHSELSKLCLCFLCGKLLCLCCC